MRGKLRIDGDAVPYNPVSLVTLILEGGASPRGDSTQEVCAVAKLKVGFSLGSTILHQVTLDLCSSFIECGYNESTLPIGSLGRCKEYTYSGLFLVPGWPSKDGR